MLRVNPGELTADPTRAFRGFFIQARLVADDSNVGGFLTGTGYRLSDCAPATVSASIKEYTWEACRREDVEPIARHTECSKEQWEEEIESRGIEDCI